MNEHFSRMVGDYLIEQQTKEERATLAQRVIAVLGVICALVLVALATNAAAEEGKPATLVAVVGENRLFLFPDPCPLGGWFATWKKAQWFYEGKPVEACWRAQRHGDGYVYADTVDAEGDAGAIPIAMFRKQEGV